MDEDVMRDVSINYKLDIIPSGNGPGRVMVPGNEPVGDTTCAVLSIYMQGKPALADVSDVLKAIPGSYILYGANFANNIGIRKSWLVFPPYRPTCCSGPRDYYGIIRRLASQEAPVEEIFSSCDVIGQGFNPSPDWDQIPAPPPDPYQPEHTSPTGVGYLPPVPPWSGLPQCQGADGLSASGIPLDESPPQTTTDIILVGPTGVPITAEGDGGVPPGGDAGEALTRQTDSGPDVWLPEDLDAGIIE